MIYQQSNNKTKEVNNDQQKDIIFAGVNDRIIRNGELCRTMGV
jgi:hypothetical protein